MNCDKFRIQLELCDVLDEWKIVICFGLQLKFESKLNVRKLFVGKLKKNICQFAHLFIRALKMTIPRNNSNKIQS